MGVLRWRGVTVGYTATQHREHVRQGLRTPSPMPCARAVQVHAKSSKVIDYEVSNLQLTEELKRNDDKYQELKRKAKMEKLQAQGM